MKEDKGPWKSNTKKLRETMKHQAETIQLIRDEINNGEQFSRLPNSEIYELPTLPDENLRQRISDLATKLGLPNFDVKDILGVQRLFAKPGLIPIVLIKFTTKEENDCWL